MLDVGASAAGRDAAGALAADVPELQFLLAALLEHADAAVAVFSGAAWRAQRAGSSTTPVLRIASDGRSATAWNPAETLLTGLAVGADPHRPVHDADVVGRPALAHPSEPLEEAHAGQPTGRPCAARRTRPRSARRSRRAARRADARARSGQHRKPVALPQRAAKGIQPHGPDDLLNDHADDVQRGEVVVVRVAVRVLEQALVIDEHLVAHGEVRPSCPPRRRPRARRR